MNWRNVKLIWWREVLDQLRDRRTLFMVAVLPLLLYPALGLGMLQMTLMFTDQPRMVVLLGEEDLPDQSLLLGDGFNVEWFSLPTDANNLKVVTKSTPEKQEPAKAEETQLTLDTAIRIKEIDFKQKEIKKNLKDLKDKLDKDQEDTEEIVGLKKKFQELAKAKMLLFSQSDFQVLIVIPKGFGKNIRKANKQLESGEGDLSKTLEYPGPIILRNHADEKSEIAHARVRDAIRNWEDQILKDRLEKANLPESFTNPVNATYVDVAQPEQIAANVWGKLFPALLVIMSLTGAFYPAVDLAAGEKERGTMETLLICPASRGEIVMGKFLTVFLFSIGTALLNILSMGLTGQHMLSQVSSGVGGGMGDFTLPGMTPIIWVVFLAIPLATLFSALSLALAVFAKSSKEGQYYLSPLLLVTMGLTVFCLSPAIEINPFYSLMPVMGPALLLKGLLTSGQSVPGLIGYSIPVLITSFAYSALALWWAVEQFRREDILFRESEQFSLSLWIRHLLRDKEETPSFAQGVFCFVLIMLVQFVTMNALREVIMPASGDPDPYAKVYMVIASQVIFIAGPALIMGALLVTKFRKTFRLYLPSFSFLIIGPLLALVLHPIVVELNGALSGFFPKIPDEVASQLKDLTDSSLPLWGSILLIALTPAICEELAFRGFILTGFARSKRFGLAIVFSSIMFGMVHLIPQQVFNATLLGLLIGLLAIKSNSLLPCLLFHFTNNALAVLHGETVSWESVNPAVEMFVSVQAKEGLRYDVPLLLISAFVGSLMIFWIFRQPNTFNAVDTDSRLPKRSMDNSEDNEVFAG